MSDSKAAVTVAVADLAAALEIVDGGFKVVAKGFGRIETELIPGLYKARASVGGASQEKIFAVEEGEGVKEVILEPVQFASPVPMDGTTTSHEYHQAAVNEAFDRPPLQRGNGAGFFLSVRDPSEAPFNQTDETIDRYAQSFTGFRLRNAAEVLIDYDQDAECDISHGYAVLAAELDPGAYVLQWSSEQYGTLERPVLLAPNWITQLFLMVEPHGETGGPLRPNFADASVQMAPFEFSYPRDKYFRLSEIARQSLLQGRNIVEREVMNALLQDKFGNPVLGLLAAHLLLLDEKPRLNLLHIVMGNLGAMLGGDFPDIVALRLRLDQLEKHLSAPPAGLSVPFPPLFKASWDILAQQATQDDAFFPPGSLSREVADRIVDNGVWLAWRPSRKIEQLILPMTDQELQHQKWQDREHILAAFDFEGDQIDGTMLLASVRKLAKPVVREKLRQFIKSIDFEDKESIEKLEDLVVRLARTLPWQSLVQKLAELDAEESFSEQLTEVQKTLIPNLLLLRQALQKGGELDHPQWAHILDSLQVPRAVLLENLRDLARLGGALATRFIEEQSHKE